ncbi:DUF5960 family protein [Aerococcaceae bacterium WGS1372]
MKENIRRLSSSSFLELEKAVTAFYDGVMPFFTLAPDIEKSMHSSGMDYFRLPASKSKDNLDHYFYFKINSDDEWEFYKFDDREKTTS